MLVNLTPDLQEIKRRKQVALQHKLKYVPQSDKRLIIETGIYRCAFDFNFSEIEFEEFKGLCNIPTEQAFEAFKPTYHKSQYGVADSIEQIKKYFKEEIEDKERKYFISITPVFQNKENKGKGGGWRWHKWGEYIGKLKPQYEHLDDEDFGKKFKYVICFHLYLVL